MNKKPKRSQAIADDSAPLLTEETGQKLIAMGELILQRLQAVEDEIKRALKNQDSAERFKGNQRALIRAVRRA
jgi:hypothetical protein